MYRWQQSEGVDNGVLDKTTSNTYQAGFGPELATTAMFTAYNSPPDATVNNTASRTATTVTSGSRIANLNTETSGYTDVANANTTPQALAVDVVACARSCPNFAATFNQADPAEVSIAARGGGSFGVLIAAGPITGFANTG